MQYIFELSGEHPKLPEAEVRACLEAERIDFKVLTSSEGILVVSTKKLNIDRIARRVALCHNIDVLLATAPSPAKLLRQARKLSLKKGTFSIRVKRIGRNFSRVSTSKLAREFGAVFRKTNKVNLTHPDQELRVLLSTKCYLARLSKRIDRTSYENRKPQYRPFFSPVSLHPKIARVLVNLARISKNAVVLDPFCGTGGILIEAGLIDAELLGADIDRKMVEGCIYNLAYFSLSAKVFQVDVGELPKFITWIDGIVTDPPYGRSASTKGENLISLYKRAFSTFQKILRKGRFLSIVLPSLNHIQLGKKYFQLVELYPLRIHRSLIRHITVYKKI